jgi:hypothetical protein
MGKFPLGLVRIIALSAICIVCGSKEDNQFGVQLSKREAELINSLFFQVNPALSENWYMPEFGKEKISRLLKEIEEKKIEVDYDLAVEWPEVSGALFVSTYSNGKPRLVIILDRLLQYIRVKGELPESITRAQKNSLAAALAHEAVHLERGIEWFKTRAQDPEERFGEEFRAYAQVDKLVIVPLLSIGEPVDQTHLIIHDYLSGCKYELPCPSFKEYLGLSPKK